MVDSVPRWQLSLSGPIQSDHLSIAVCDDTVFGAGTLLSTFLERKSYPAAIETLGLYETHALDFIGCRIKESTGEKQATSHLMQAIGVAIHSRRICLV